MQHLASFSCLNLGEPESALRAQSDAVLLMKRNRYGIAETDREHFGESLWSSCNSFPSMVWIRRISHQFTELDPLVEVETTRTT